jgi:hypothetical protein
MTAAEKAKELVDKYFNPEGSVYKIQAKKYALIAVEEIIVVVKGKVSVCNSPACKYWYEVKQEINLL